MRREAKTLAALNHPNIAQVLGVEEEGATRALLMELVEDLSAHVARGPIAWADALPIARRVAEALEAAHAQGIVHRDLKPANVKVRADGTVKVLDNQSRAQRNRPSEVPRYSTRSAVTGERRDARRAGA